MRIALTGASGCIGRHFQEQVRGHLDVVALCRRPVPDLPSDIQRISDFSEPDLTAAFTGCQAVLHLAARRPGLPGDPVSFADNVDLDSRVFAAAAMAAVPRVVFASTRSVYGRLPTPWHERSEPTPSHPYALAKRQSEIIAEGYRVRGLNIVTLRLGQLFGASEQAGTAVATFFDNARKGLPISVTVAGIHREYIAISDLCTALIRALAPGGPAGIFNVGSGESVSIEALARLIAAAYGREHLVTVAANLDQCDEVSLMDSSRFRAAFRWRPKSLTEAARELVQNEQAARATRR